ncbi:predicted protein [Scheffersomyces stipitis CBS 6054]|uniref:Inner kinetochore subunit AME1 domain-containing protein n=1 Tax=Scheffersomyces stipitis (strain ATCC 58785 / CBS 6054 / NBRC 10063 / NRRL Y-11545) TaxID=322104 RepID=A3LZI4_PICST|nr:predicted protein [Scheffersomyces stipitis CBS 6054]ABN68341.2 predicted protein [Scheffersomyces stipitis CBS 6054]
MAVDDRVSRKKSRVRGSGKRNVLVDDFFVLNKQSTSDKPSKKRRLTDSLKSALNHWDNIESLPRLRNRKVSAIGKADLDNANSKTTTPVPQDRGEQEESQPQNKSVHSVALHSEEAGELLTPSHLINQSIYDEIEYTGNHNQDESLQVTNSDVSVRKSATDKTNSGRGRPKKRARVNVGRPRKVDKPKNNLNSTTEAAQKDTIENNEHDSSAETSFRRESLRKTRRISYKEMVSDNEKEESSEDEKIEYAFRSLAARTLRQKSRLKQFLGGVDSPEEAEIVEEPHTRIRKIRDNVKKRQNELRESQERNKVSNGKTLRKSKSSDRTTTSDNTKSNGNKSRKAKSKSRVESTETGPESRIERVPSRVRERVAPIPLSRKRRNERQKPMNIDVERLRDEENKDKRVKIHTIDVLRHLVKEYEPEETASEVIREQVVQEDFKAHLVHQLDYLMDVHSAINDITTRINEVQKLKNEYRQRIYTLKQNHVDVGTKLNTLRSQYNRDKDRHAEVQMVETEMKSLQQIGNTTEDAKSSLSQQVTVALSRASSIVNPSAGVLRKLQIVNQKLVDLDKELL